jgi:type I protein arginine methyltransferase
MPRNRVDLTRPHTGPPADVIPLQYHVPMLLDQHRMDSFVQAIVEVVQPGMHVLDLGAGTGVLSFFAAQRGARVTAIEREPVVLAAARSALATAGGQRIRLLHADARSYTPDEPVDVVLCEMMHVGQLRERQIEVIGGLKKRYRARFGGPLPRFLPEACLQAVQPVQQDFTFHGYAVAAPHFQDPFARQDRTIELAPPQVYQQFFYDDVLPDTCSADLEFTVDRAGWVNAIRIVTKNILAARIAAPGTVDWLMNYLVVPLPSPCYAEPRQRVRITFSYRPGDQIHTLAESARVHRVTAAPGRTRGGDKAS